MTKPFSRFVCWKSDRISEVINKEALSVAKDAFFATHVPMRQLTYEKEERAITDRSEEGLLSELLSRAHADQHTFIIIKGAPGTGKSHLIRWLKERYAAERPDDVVLLVERSNTSLKGTLQNIIDSGIFEQTQLPKSLQRLEQAVTSISDEGLGDALLNALQLATKELRDKVPPEGLDREQIADGLLEQSIRAFLKAPQGPIERVKHFMKAGRNDNRGGDDVPGFTADDLRFSKELNEVINKLPYPEIYNLSLALNQGELRAQLADYLNSLLRSYAISRVMGLTSQDLQDMFSDLRRFLRRQGKALAIFIEDITGLTGIHEGLLNVLIAQHHGDSENSALCRLTSVVGVTDAYYSDHVPSNIQARATYRIALGSAQNISLLMADPKSRAELAARYLNAIRKERPEFRQWADFGGDTESMPIACDTCPFQQVCHASFGSVDLGTADNRQAVGLYPFNSTVLDRLYNGLDDKTPRTFLDSLLAYILLSHTEKIETGEFPPRMEELVTRIQPPSFTPPTHRRIVEDQGGTSAARLMTLLLFWGDRTVQRRGETLGGLRAAVFSAFGLPMIEGVPTEPETQAAVTAPSTAVPTTTTAATSADLATSIPVTAPKKAISDEAEKLMQAVEVWINGGRLNRYDRFGTWLADFISTFIDWQAHGISLKQVNRYITQGRIQFEGQSASPQYNHVIQFTRADRDLPDVLYALINLNANREALTPDQYGEYLARLSHWMREQTPRIVEFVREPSGLKPPQDYLLGILARNVVLLACLAGKLSPTDSLIDQYHKVIAFCASEKPWSEYIAAMSNFPEPWQRLARDIEREKNAVATCRDAFLQLLNRPQGESTNVLYVNAPALLNILKEFNDAVWHLPPISYTPQKGDSDWKAAVHIYEVFQQGFVKMITASREALKSGYDDVRSILGQDSAVDTIQAVRAALRKLRDEITYDRKFDDLNDDLKWNPQRLDDALDSADVALRQQELRGQALYLSSVLHEGAPLMAKQREFLKDLRQMLDKAAKDMQGKAESNTTTSDAERDRQKVINTYRNIATLLKGGQND